jgi:hypothetical protein
VLLHHHKLLLLLAEVLGVRAGPALSRSRSAKVLEMLILPGEDLGALAHEVNGLLKFWLTQIIGLSILLHMRMNVEDLLLM